MIGRKTTIMLVDQAKKVIDQLVGNPKLSNFVDDQRALNILTEYDLVYTSDIANYPDTVSLLSQRTADIVNEAFSLIIENPSRLKIETTSSEPAEQIPTPALTAREELLNLIDECISQNLDTIAVEMIIDNERALNKLKRLGIETIFDLSEITKENGLITNKSLDAILDILRVMLSRKSPFISLQEAFNTLNDREKEIIYDRYGLIREKKTLAGIGEDYGLSRERIRQIQSKIINKLKRIEPLIDPDIFSRLSSAAKKTLPLPKVLNLSEIYKNQGVVELFVDAFPELNLYIYDHNEISEQLLIMADAEDSLNAKLNHLHKLLLAQEGAVSISEIARLVGLDEKIILLMKETTVNNGLILHNKNRNVFMTAQDKVLAALRQQSRPMTVKDLIKLTRLDEIQVRGVLQREYIGVVNVGKSTYALKEWGYMKGGSGEVIVDFLRNSGEPRTTKEIIAYVKKYREVKDVSIYAALVLQKDVVQIDRGWYALKEWNLQSNYTYEKKKYPIRAEEAVLSILKNSKQPVSIYDIKLQIETLFGTKASSNPITISSVLVKLKASNVVKYSQIGRSIYYT